MPENNLENINGVLEELRIAKSNKNWSKVEALVIHIFRQLINEIDKEISLLDLVNLYLGSLVGNEKFSVSLDEKFQLRVNQGVDRLKVYLRSRPAHDLRIDNSIRAAQNIAILSIDASQHNKHKIASNLRKIGRPDISIELCLETLKRSRLNFYAQTILCASYCDLENFQNAIEFAEDALKYSPKESQHYSLVTLSRAHLMKGKKTGELDDLYLAKKYAVEAIDLVLDNYTLNTFRAVAYALQDKVEIEKSKEFELLLDQELVRSDESINNIILEVIENDIYFESATLEVSNSHQSNLINLVADISNQKNMNFKTEEIASYLQSNWYFVAELKSKCRICQKSSLAIFAHHVLSEPQLDHEWAYACWYCRYITDGRIFSLEFLSNLKRSFKDDSWGMNCPYCI